MSEITHIAVALPDHPASQSQIRDVFGAAFPLEGRRLAAALTFFDAAAIDTRYGVLPLSELIRPRTLSETTNLYAASVRALAEVAARRVLVETDVDPLNIDLVISVSCTGFMLPSMDAYLLDALGLRRDVRRLPLTELGCVGGAAALARAHDFLLGHPAGRVLIVAVELPSLNFQAQDLSVDNLVSSALFGDGAAAVLMTGDAAIRAGHPHLPFAPVEVRATHCHTIPESADALGFVLRDDGFHSILARKIPDLLRAAARDLFDGLAKQGQATRRDLQAFVLHPGGKRILMALQESLDLTTADVAPSWDVLRRFGNQSSASVLFVLNEWMTAHRPPSGTLGALAAFGPGLTAESVLLKWT